jgi:hypothetical protein
MQVLRVFSYETRNLHLRMTVALQAAGEPGLGITQAVSYGGDAGSTPGQVVWDLWWK